MVKKYPYWLVPILLAACQQARTPRAEAQENTQQPAGESATKNSPTLSEAHMQLPHAEAYWLEAGTFAWKKPASNDDGKFFLYSGNIRAEGDHFRADRQLELKDTSALKDAPELAKKYPYLKDLRLLKNGTLQDQTTVQKLLSGGAVVAYQNKDGRVLAATGVQYFGVLDAIFPYGGNDLGVNFNATGVPVFKLWAPTAQAVRLLRFADAKATEPQEAIPLKLTDQGVWVLAGKPEWKNQFYLYEVDVFAPSEGKMERNRVTDPYSFSLSQDSRLSQVLDIHDPALYPSGWENVRKPGMEHPTDMSLYELHVRDFSIGDTTVPPEHRGKFAAFTDAGSAGMRHLKSLAGAGITHVHLLPVFDFAAVNENPGEREEPVLPMDGARNAETQQETVAKLQAKDSFNWGYDPFHYFAPEGSYATDADGSARVREFREMIKSLNDAGLRVVMDVVFNHTSAAGLTDHSVLDKVVPGYFYRLDAEGQIQTSTCCPDTASEHTMMQKLMADALVFWAKNYKIDGFRFDLMGHHTTDNLLFAKSELANLTLEKDGVDGKNIYFYGEGWKYGSLDAILPQKTCTQANNYDTGIGTFNDRLRDRVRGGNVSHDSVAEQGYATGMYYDFNGIVHGDNTSSQNDQREKLLDYSDTIRLGLAGNLRDYSFKAARGNVATGTSLLFNGTPVGYAGNPAETINYVSAHDNLTLFDQVQAKAPFEMASRTPNTAPLEERERMAMISMGVVALGQGVPFFHAGDEILRSKSGDGDSYDSGDWFNHLDFSLQSNNWGIGLPLQSKNSSEWPHWTPRLADASLRPGAPEMEKTREYFKALLRVRKSSPLFHLATREQIQQRVRFLDSENAKGIKPGLIAMHIEDTLQAPVDSERKSILVLINPTLNSIEFQHAGLANRNFTLHPELNENTDDRLAAARFDQASGQATVPAQSIEVWEEKR